MNNMNFKMTPLEKKWVLYDVGNSAFSMLVSTIFPIYFNYLAENAGDLKDIYDIPEYVKTQMDEGSRRIAFTLKNAEN